MEFGVPVWNCGITQEEVYNIERVQKAFLYIALGQNYTCYQSALDTLELETLEERRLQLCKTFAKRASEHPKHQKWFEKYENVGSDTRSKKTTYKTPLARLDRFKESPIPYLTSLLNSK